jgi:hypothetical protein
MPDGGDDVRIPEIVLGFLIATAIWTLLAALGLPDLAPGWLQRWQPLVGATVGATITAIAVYFAIQNTNRTIRQADDLETRRLRRKRAALRAALPLALAAVITHAEQSANELGVLLKKFSEGKLPPNAVPPNLLLRLPTEALSTLADFIECSDELNVSVLEATIAWIQIHKARVGDIVIANQDPASRRLVLQREVEGCIIDAASIYAGAAAIFEYARRQKDHLPATVSWDDVTNALGLMHFLGQEFPNLQQIVTHRGKRTSGPFEGLSRG